MVRIFNIAATPQGGSELCYPLHATRGRGSLRSPHPLAMFPEPPRGFPAIAPFCYEWKRLAMFPEPLRGFPAFLAFRSNSIFVVM